MLSVLLKAVNDLRKAGDAASARAELGTDIPSAARYVKVEQDYFDHELEDDMDGNVSDMSELKISHDPLSGNIDLFRHLGRSRAEADAAAENEPVVRPEESGFAGFGDASDDDDDGIDFNYGKGDHD